MMSAIAIVMAVNKPASALSLKLDCANTNLQSRYEPIYCSSTSQLVLHSCVPKTHASMYSWRLKHPTRQLRAIFHYCILSTSRRRSFQYKDRTLVASCDSNIVVNVICLEPTGGPNESQRDGKINGTFGDHHSTRLKFDVHSSLVDSIGSKINVDRQRSSSRSNTGSWDSKGHHISYPLSLQIDGLCTSDSGKFIVHLDDPHSLQLILHWTGEYRIQSSFGSIWIVAVGLIFQGIDPVQNGPQIVVLLTGRVLRRPYQFPIATQFGQHVLFGCGTRRLQFSDCL